MDLELEGLDRAEDDYVGKARKVLFLSMSKVEELAVLRCPVDTGRLKNSINLFPRSPGSDEYTVSDGVSYGVFLEYGTLPHHPPPRVLRGWARRKLKDEQAAYSVAAKISKFGTPAQPFFRPSLHQVKNIELPKIWNKVFSKG